jgi:hypothetical protein
VAREHGDVASADAERRDVDLVDGESEEEILAEAPLANGGAQVSVGRCNDAERRRALGTTTDAPKAVFLEHAEDLCLSAQWKFPNFIKKKRAAVGFFDATEAPFCRAGEGATLHTKQLRFEEWFRDGGAVHRDEGRRPPSSWKGQRPTTDGARDRLLPGPCLADDEDRHVAPAEEAHLVDKRT